MLDGIHCDQWAQLSDERATGRSCGARTSIGSYPHRRTINWRSLAGVSDDVFLGRFLSGEPVFDRLAIASALT